MVMIYILYLPVAKLDAMVANLDVRCEKVRFITLKNPTFSMKTSSFAMIRLSFTTKR
jgi:hypothetical protein